MGRFFYSRISAQGYAYRLRLEKEARRHGGINLLLRDEYYNPDLFRHKILSEMEKCGSHGEHEWLRLILDGIWKLKNKRLSQDVRRLVLLNLMRDVVNLWAHGKIEQTIAAKEQHRRQVKELMPTHDTRWYELFRYANVLHEHVNTDAVKKRDFLRKHHRDMIAFPPGRRPLHLKEGIPKNDPHLDSVTFMLKDAAGINYSEALRRANDGGRFLPPDDFKDGEVALRNAYKTWRDRRAKKLHKK
jgi:hypothetical protein